MERNTKGGDGVLETLEERLRREEPGAAILSDGPKRPAEVRDTLGIASSNYFTARYITPLKDAGFIEPVNVAGLHSPRQAYKLTPKGRKAPA